MHILVCDDDAVFAAQMDEYISEWFRAREIQVQSTVCTSGEQLLATPELERYQLAFLDVDLKTTDGIALGRKLRQVAPDIVLVYISAYLEFAPQGYTVNAYRYLLKRDIAAQLPSCLEDIFAGMTDPKKTLEVRHNRTTSEIPLDQIYYLESDLRQINIYGDIPHQPICTFYGKIADLPAMLYENGFLQVGRSDVVNLQYVRSIRNYKVELRSGVELNASRQGMEFLSRNNIDTLTQLETHRQALQTEIGQLLTKRKQLPKTDEVQSQHESVNTALKQLRQEERLCRKIAEHSLEVQQYLTEARRDRAEQQQREQEHERDRRPNIDLTL